MHTPKIQPCTRDYQPHCTPHNAHRPRLRAFCATRPIDKLQHVRQPAASEHASTFTDYPTSSVPRQTSTTATSCLCSSSTTQAAQPLGRPESASTSQPSFNNRPHLHDPQGRLRLKNLTCPELEEWCHLQGEDTRRARQLWRWMYADWGLVRGMEDTVSLQDGLSEKFVQRYREEITLEGGLERLGVARAQDGTRKVLFRVIGGEGHGGTVEAVLIPVVREQGTRPRITLCVSSQVGCAMNCQFCYTGRMGLLGNLTASQIVEQVVEARRLMAEEGDAATLTNIVFMGMGEPLHNLPAVLPATSIMAHPLGLHLSHNKITVSTVGLIPEMRQLAATSNVSIALSLHAVTDEVRDWVVPVNRRHNLAELRQALLDLFPKGGRGARRVLIEYVMLRGVNDTPEDAEGLVRLLDGVAAKVNLIVFNPHEGTRFQPSLPEAVTEFRSVLIQRGRVCTVRDSRGDDEMAACGQLGSAELAARPPPVLEPPPRFREVMGLPALG